MTGFCFASPRGGEAGSICMMTLFGIYVNARMMRRASLTKSSVGDPVMIY